MAVGQHVAVVPVGFGVGAKIVHCCQVGDSVLPAVVAVVEVGNTMGMDGNGCRCHQLFCMAGCFFQAFFRPFFLPFSYEQFLYEFFFVKISN
jgi:hypothetical protein